MKRYRLLLALVACGFASSALAHFPFCTCKAEGSEIVCEGGFSDGSGAEGVTVDLISYDEELIQSTALNGQSLTRLDPYAGEFYILLDAGPGHTVEIDWTEIEGLE